MVFLFNKYAAPLVLLLTLFVFSGTVSSSFTVGEQQAPVQCCDKEAVPETPANEGECSECGCLTCSAALEASFFIKNVVALPMNTPQWGLSQGHPYDYIRSIDYPPEVV